MRLLHENQGFSCWKSLFTHTQSPATISNTVVSATENGYRRACQTLSLAQHRTCVVFWEHRWQFLNWLSWPFPAFDWSRTGAVWKKTKASASVGDSPTDLTLDNFYSNLECSLQRSSRYPNAWISGTLHEVQDKGCLPSHHFLSSCFLCLGRFSPLGFVCVLVSSMLFYRPNCHCVGFLLPI